MELIVDIEKKLNGFCLKTQFTVSDEVIGLLGASGSGKSMTLRCIAGLDTPTCGKIIFNDRIFYDSEKRINLTARKRKVGFLFQNYALFPHMTVAQNIGFALEDISRREKEERVREKIYRMRLNGLEHRYPSQLSGGQQQRVALARALAVEPEILLLDEPFSAMDNHLRSQMENQLLETLTDYKGVTLFVSHNMDETYRICNQLIVMSDGLIAASGSKDRIFQDPPTLSAARITGCKNISKAKLDDDGMIEAQDWGCKIKVEKNLPGTVSYIGIRARHIIHAQGSNRPNVFPCRPVKVVEGPHSVTVYVDIENEVKESKESHIHWEISKDQWLDIKDRPLPWMIELNPKRLFVIE